MKHGPCRWCGKRTENMTGICDDCWRDRERIYVERKAKEAAAGLSPPRRAAIEKAAKAASERRKRTTQLP